MQINIRNLNKYYDNSLVLDNINLSINHAKAIGIIGKSGCGKSTLLRHLSGIEFADSGIIKINNMVIDKKNISKYQSNIGYVFQKHNLFPHLSIRENLDLILNKIYKYKDTDSKKRIDEVLNEFHLLDIADKIPSKVSGGQAQRASIARAVLTKPDVLFLDEPTASLDPLLTKEVLDSIITLKEIGSEFIFVTHEIDFLKKFADYFIFIDNGKIIEHGYIDTLSNPSTKKLNDFINR